MLSHTARMLEPFYISERAIAAGLYLALRNKTKKLAASPLPESMSRRARLKVAERMPASEAFPRARLAVGENQ